MLITTGRRLRADGLAGAAVVTLVAALFMRETNGIDLASVDQADREELAKAGVV